MNKSSSAGQRIFCPQPSVRKMGNTYSIPAFSIPCPETKSLAASSRRFNQSFPHCTNGCQIAKIPPNPISSICIAHTSFKTHILQTVPRLGSRQIIPPQGLSKAVRTCRRAFAFQIPIGIRSGIPVRNGLPRANSRSRTVLPAFGYGR